MTSTIFTQVFRFGVPVFIVLWAYFADKTISKKYHYRGDQIYYLASKFVVFFILFVIASLGYFFIHVDWQTFNLKSMFTQHWSGYGWSGQYFFVILFQLIPLMFFYRKLSPKWHVCITMSGLLLYLSIGYILFQYNLISKIGDRLFVYWLPYVSLGILFSRGIFPLPKELRWCLLALLVFLIPMEFYLLKELSISHSEYLIPSVFVGTIGILSIIFGPLQKSEFAIHSSTIRIFQWIGASSLGIYVLNPAVIMFIRYLNLPKIPTDIPIVSQIMPFVTTGVVIALCYGIILILRKTPLRRLNI